MVNEKNKKKQPNRKKPSKSSFRFNRGLVFIGLGVLVVTIIFIGLRLAPYSPFWQVVGMGVDTAELGERAANARSDTEPMMSAQKDTVRREVLSTGLFGSAPVSSRVTDKCELLRQTDPGNMWVVVDWAQTCRMTQSLVFETGADRETIIRALAALPIDAISDPERVVLSKQSKTSCDVLSHYNSSLDVIFIDWSRGYSVGCNLGQSSKAHNKFEKIYQQEGADIFIMQKSYVSIAFSGVYFNESVGCGQKGMFGCKSPIENPVPNFR